MIDVVKGGAGLTDGRYVVDEEDASVSRTRSHLLDQVSQSVCQPVSQPVSQPVIQSVSQSASQPVSQSVSQSVSQLSEPRMNTWMDGC